MSRYTEWTHEEVEMDDGTTLVVLSILSEDGSHEHCMPFQAIADRMELFGLNSVAEAIEFIIRDAEAPEEVTNELYKTIYPAYRDVVSAEYSAIAASRGTVSMRRATSAPTILGVDAVSSATRSKLQEARDNARSLLGMQAANSPVRLMAASAEKPAVSTGKSEVASSVIAGITDFVEKNSGLLEYFRVSTAAGLVPEFKKAAEEAVKVEGEKNA